VCRWALASKAAAGHLARLLRVAFGQTITAPAETRAHGFQPGASAHMHQTIGAGAGQCRGRLGPSCLAVGQKASAGRSPQRWLPQVGALSKHDRCRDRPPSTSTRGVVADR